MSGVDNERLSTAYYRSILRQGGKKWYDFESEEALEAYKARKKMRNAPVLRQPPDVSRTFVAAWHAGFARTRNICCVSTCQDCLGNEDDD